MLTLDPIPMPMSDDALREAWRALVGKGQDADDVSKAKRHPWRMTLRAADRARALHRPKAIVLAYYAEAFAFVAATYPEDNTTPAFSVVSLAEEDANHGLNRVQTIAGCSPTPVQKLSIAREVRRQIATSIDLLACVYRSARHGHQNETRPLAGTRS